MKPIRLVIISSLMVIAIGCSTATVKYNYDSKSDFTSLKTFSFMPLPDEANICTLNVKLIQDTVRTQLEFKGLTMVSDNSDILIAMHLTKELKRATVRNTGFTAIGYSPGYFKHSSFTHELEYEEGTFVLDLVDTQSNALIWRGVIIGEIRDDMSSEWRIERTKTVLQEILTNFPPAQIVFEKFMYRKLNVMIFRSL